MGNKEFILAIAKDLKSLADNLQGLVGATQEITSEPNEAIAEKTEAINEVATKVTIEDVRAVLAVKTRDGKTALVKTLLSEFGADKLSSVPLDKLAELKSKAEVL